MGETEQRGLQRLDSETWLPPGFEQLNEEEQHTIILRLADEHMEVRKIIAEKVGKSKLAEHDLAVVIEAVEKLDHERKIYSVHKKGESGSGTYDVRIRGGDTRFIIPILIVIGAVILGIILILTLR